MMKERVIRRRTVWSVSTAACLTIPVCVILVQMRTYSVATAPVATDPDHSESDLSLIYEKREPVGWVFGRVVGFEGADKPLLPRRTLPAPNRLTFGSPGSP
jgi:hypothetical protein